MTSEVNTGVEISVVIPTYEDAQCLELTLRSLRRQSLAPERFEVIVVRDGGDGGEYTDVADAGKGLNLRLVELPERQGRAAARNAGVRHASADLLLFLDSDSYATPELVERHLMHHRGAGRPAVLLGRRDELGLPYVNAALAGEPTIPVPHRRADGGGDLRFPAGVAPVGEEWLQAGWMFAYTHNVSVSRALFDAVGGFDERFGLRWGLEDIELFYRVHEHLGLHDRNFAFDEAAAAYHLPHHRNVDRNWQEFGTNRSLAAEKYLILEWEFFGMLDVYDSAERVVGYRAAIADCLARSACRIGTAVALLTPQLPGERVLWVGTGSDRTTLPEGAVTFDFSVPVSATNHHLIGMDPPIAPGSLDAVVSVDFWRYLRWEEFCQFVNVGGALAGEVHLVHTGAELANAVAPDMSTFGYLTRVLRTAFDSTVGEVEGLGTVLRLRPRVPPALPAE
ncbi:MULTISPECIES: glycosyltransferase family 2 protein [unclassified Micromonospora]|uniref:glycosyltransferase family 2 protein n=1 Tax=unclassified Micromonospora TaxID=2617518 RepID=UPI00103322C7|nr:glycosyltransferase family 2 protein [Verrucosispora sp. SN26_14.1]TBL39846.1 glycosyltransferase family 2 protein [Verrucosispora sp. SN26_14.1]